MLDEVIEQDVELALSSDSHNQKEIGDFSYQLKVLKEKDLTLSDFRIFPGKGKF